MSNYQEAGQHSGGLKDVEACRIAVFTNFRDFDNY
jgi:hypothetical protein